MNRLLRRSMSCMLAITVALSGIVIVGKKASDVQAADQYELVWYDEFNGTELNRNYWNVEVNGDGGGNWEHQYYVDNPENISVNGGTLKITARQSSSYPGKEYTSGRINTKKKAEFTYGRIEARMKLPSFQGAWPAFWMLGANYSSVGWPKCGEIDIMEAINTENFTHGAVHWDVNGQADEGVDSSSVVGSNFDRTQWHTYAIEWNENSIKWSVDDAVFYTQKIDTSHMEEFTQKHFIIFNLAVGGTWPGHTIDNTAIPATMEVDYVRVYQKDSDNGSISGSAIPEEPTVEVPTRIEEKNVLEGMGAWTTYYGSDWAAANGSGTSTDSFGYTLNINNVGNREWGIQESIKGLEYIPGETYTYSFTMTSDVTKNVIVKVVGEDSEEDIFSMDYITLKAGEPYTYSKEVTIDSSYRGRLDLFFGMGGGVNGENIAATTKMTITMENASFTGKVSYPVEIPTENPTVNSGTDATEQADTTTKKATLEAIKKVKASKAKIVSATKKKSAKKAKITIKKVKKATGYVVKISTKKKFKKKTTIKVVTKNRKVTIKKLKKNKKYYVKARAYIKVDGKVYYGKWSKAKKVNFKK